MILELLCSLNRYEIVETASQAVDFIFIVAILSITEVIRRVLYFQSHVATNSSTFRIQLHMLVHFEDSISFWLNTNVSQHAVVRIKQLAKALEEEHMGIKFS